MKTTLSAILHTRACTAIHVLELKRKLLLLRKTGIVYIAADLSALGEEEEFELYLYATPAQASILNPFPIPIHLYQGSAEELVRRFYFEYYQQEIKAEDLSQYLTTKPYRGQKYIWYHRTNA